MKKFISIFIALALATASIFTFCACNNSQQEEKCDMKISVATANNMSVAISKPLMTTTTNSSNTQTITATVTPSSASSLSYTWNIEFVNPDSDWASGKAVTDYVTVTKSNVNDLTAQVTMLQRFSEQIKVTVSCNNLSNVSASCLVDCYKELEEVQISFINVDSQKEVFSFISGTQNSVDSFVLQDVYVKITPTFTDGTIQPSVVLQFYTQSSTELGYDKENITYSETYQSTNGYCGEFRFWNDYEHSTIINGEKMYFDVLCSSTKFTSFTFTANCITSASLTISPASIVF